MPGPGSNSPGAAYKMASHIAFLSQANHHELGSLKFDGLKHSILNAILLVNK